MEHNLFLTRFYELRKTHSESTSVDTLHYVQSLETGEEALLARIHAVRTAKRSIDIQTFLWANDEVGRFVFYELLQAANRGVSIRLLIDGWAVVGKPSFLAWMCEAHERIEVKRYSPPAGSLEPSKLRLAFDLFGETDALNQRAHKKLFLVDENLAILGGRNYQNAYYDRGTGLVFRDRDVLLIGSEIAEMTQAFEKSWSHERAVEGCSLHDLDRWHPEKESAYLKREDLNYHDLFESIDSAASNNDTMESKLQQPWFAVHDVEYKTDPPQSSPLELNTTVRFVADQIARVEKRLLLQSPYFVLDEFLFDAMQELRSKNPHVEFLVSTNSMASSDTPIAYAHGFRERVQYLACLLLQIFEFRPHPADLPQLLGWHGEKNNFRICCHAKTFVFDEKAVWIGSLNLDPRSARVNTENGILIRDVAFSSFIAQQILRDIQPENSWAIGFSKDAPVIGRLREIFSNVDSTLATPTEDVLRFPTAFEFAQDGEQVPFFHPEFYSRYREVGSFPEVQGSLREFKARVTSLLPKATKRFV